MSKFIKFPAGVVSEMNKSFSEGKVDVPLAKGVDLDKLLENDDDPLFITIDALSDTISKNKRVWTSDELHNVARQVMEKKVDGYQGHLTQEERSSKNPDAVTMWLGAKVANHKGKNRLFIKGYILPRAEQFKDYLRRAAAVGKNVAVSVYGQAFEKWNETLEAFEVDQFQLESIDWARPGSEGVPNSGYLKLTAEMDGGENEMTKEEALKQVTVTEMKEHAPTIVQEIETQAQAELRKTVSEMTKALGLKDSDTLPKVVSEMKAQKEALETQVAESEIDKILGNRVSNVAARQTLRKMVIGEMKSTELKAVQETVQTVLDSAEGKALSEAFKTPVVTPSKTDNRQQKSGSRFIKK